MTPAMAAHNDTGHPKALPLVFTHYEKSLYDDDVKCLYDNDTFTEVLNEDLDSFVLNPWAWNKGGIFDPAYFILVPVTLVTIATNILVLKTFIRHNLKSAVHTILIALAISNTLTVLVPSIAVLYQMVDGVNPDYIKFEYCRIYGYLTKYLPTITHTVSIWLTVVLAIDRYLAVQHPFFVRRACFPRTSLCVIAGIYVLAILGHLCRFVDTDYVPVKIISAEKIKNNIEIQNLRKNSTVPLNNSRICALAKGVTTCRAVYATGFEDFIYYEFLYYWFVIIFVKFIPCSCLIALDTLMLRSLQRADSFRRTSSGVQGRNQMVVSRSHYSETKRTTVIIIIAVIIVVIVELPIGITLLLWTLSEIHGSTFMDENTLNTLGITANMVVYVSYPILFIMYCSVSEKFRRNFCQYRACCRQQPRATGTPC